MANDGRILLSFKPPGFFTSTKYEQLRINEADAAVLNTSTDENDDEDDKEVPGRLRGESAHDSDEDEDEEDDDEEEEEEEEPKKGSKFQVNSRVGGFFGLLQDGEDEDESESEEDENDASK